MISHGMSVQRRSSSGFQSRLLCQGVNNNMKTGRLTAQQKPNCERFETPYYTFPTSVLLQHPILEKHVSLLCRKQNFLRS